MRIDKIQLSEFRGFEQKEFSFDPHFNVLIGENGSGKTTILEALTVAINPFVAVITEATSNVRSIKKDDVRRVSFEYSLESKINTGIVAEGIIDNTQAVWSIGKPHRDFGYLKNDDAIVRKWANECRNQLAHNGGEDLVLPMFCYLGAGRLWTDSTEKAKIFPKGSRLEGYTYCLNAKGHFKRFVEWFKTMELSALQGDKVSKENVEIVRRIVIDTLDGWDHMFHSVSDDMLMVRKEGSDNTLPFHYLSDGQRNMIGLIADLAYRCILLNPYLRKDCTKKTPGIVLIDEIDLHLHPNWQRSIVQKLKDAFPMIQFIATTHSPFIVQSLESKELISMEGDVDISPNDLSIEEVAENVMGVESQFSEENEDMARLSLKYFKLLRDEPSTKSVELDLDKIESTISDPGLRAFLQMKRLGNDQKKNNNETN